MEKIENIQSATPESIWALLHENARQMQETDRRMQETDRRMQETDKMVKELTQSQKETDRVIKESRKETDKIIKELIQSRKETDRVLQKTGKQMKELQKTMGGMAKSHGDFAEEYFFTSFEEGQNNFFGEKFDTIDKNLKSQWQGLRDEYDIVLYNHTSVAIIEVKYRARIHDIPKTIKKAQTFRILFPYYKDFKIYLGFASMSFYPKLEQECIKQGIAVIKQIGDVVLINDGHLRVY